MKRIAPLLLATFVALAAAPASAQRMPVPIVNHPDVPVQRGPGQPAPSAEEVRKAIVAAADATGRHWVLTEPSPGQMVATYHVRTHTVVTDIRYSATQFSVNFRESVNMKYAPGGPTGTGVIHPFYNQWVQDFVRAIQLELARVN